MKQGMMVFDELEMMRARMDQVWKDLFVENPGGDDAFWQWVETFPKFEGTGRTYKARLNKIVKSV